MSEQRFEPDWLSAPGGTILDVLEERGLSSRELAELLDYSIERAERLIAGKDAITRDVARLLSARIGGSERFWISRESNYRQDIGRLQRNGHPEAARAWLDELPIKDMRRLGVVPASGNSEETLKAALQFFAVADVDEWRRKYSKILSAVNFRTSPTYKSEPGSVLTWLRYGEVRSSEIKTRPWNATSFERALIEIRRLTRAKEPSVFVPILRQLCAEHGVCLVFARPPAGCHASGATRFLTKQKAMILLSFRYLSDDHFWFTFFHEAGHLLLHGDKSFFIEDGSEVSLKEEHEANLFAQSVLIPPEVRAEFLSLAPTRGAVMKFAVKIGIARGIVVGQLQHQGKLKRDQLNYLKRRYTADDLKSLN
jgi:HTH-type transcriptional regulator / antitoxin HigA